MADTIIGAEVSRGGFFNVVRNPSTGKPDITYTADEMREPYKGLITDGVFSGKYVNGSGVVVNNTNNFMVSSGGSDSLKVIVSAGRGIFDGHWFRTTEDILVDNIESETTLDCRYDNILVVVNNNTRTIRLAYRKGGASQPSLTTTPGIVEYRLAKIAVWKNASIINDKDITDLRGKNHPEGTPWVSTVGIDQLSTDQLFKKWENLFQSYFTYMQHQVETWSSQIESATANHYLALSSNQVVKTIQQDTREIIITAPNEFPALGANEYYVPLVTVNGYLLTKKETNTAGSPGDYFMQNISANSMRFIFNNTLTVGTRVTFQLLKAVTAIAVPAIDDQINALNSSFSAYVDDHGWSDNGITPAAGVTVDSNEPDPEIRIRKIGGMVFLRGAVKVNPVQGNVICTLPATNDAYSNIRPQKNHIFASNSKNGSNKSPDRASIIVRTNGSVEFWTTTRLSGETADTASTWHLNTCWPVPYMDQVEP